jgi:hypothetical protein
MFHDWAMVFEQAPIVLPAAECAPHGRVASSEYDEIACLSIELGFQAMARRRARKL